METVVANLSGRVRRETLNGRKYLVALATLINPGVLAGSKGPLLYPSDVVAKNPPVWNGMPLVGYHPKVDGKPVSARQPSILEKHGLGFMFEAAFNGKLGAESWFDEELTGNFDKTLLADKQVVPRLLRGEAIELSTGLFTVDEPAEPGATHNGVAYTHIVRSYFPDHVAVLPDQIGACSIADGCGIHVNADEKKTLLRKLGEMLGLVGNAGPNEPSHSDLRQRLADLIEKRFGGGGAYGDLRACYVVDVFDKEVVYEAQGKTWRLGYTSDLRTGAVELAQDAPEEVRRTTVYKPVTNTAIPDVAWCPNCGAEIDDIDADGAVCPRCGESWDLEELTDNKGGDMKLTDNHRKETVDFIVTNCDCWKGHAEALAKLPDDQLVRIKTDAEKAKELEATVNALKKEFTDATTGATWTWNAEKSVWESKPKPPIPAFPDPALVKAPMPTMSVNEWLASVSAPPEIQSAVRNGMESEARERTALVERIVTANASTDPAKAQIRPIYQAMPLEQLRLIANSLPAPTQNQGGPLPNWSGAAPAVNAAPDDSANLLPVFASDLDELASPALRRKRA